MKCLFKKTVNVLRKPIVKFPIIYITTMIIFALIYYKFLPYQFYHDTVKYEDVLSIDFTNIMNEIKNVIRNVQQDYDDKIIVNSKVYIDKNSIDVDSFKFSDGNKCSFNINFFVIDNTEFSTVGTFYALSCIFDLNRFRRFENTTIIFLEINEDIIMIDKNYYDDLNFEYTDIIKTLFPKKDNGVFVLSMEMPRKLHDSIIDYKHAISGFPSGSSGQFLRMLYLSTFTISAASQGDILPITPLARALVAFETIIGILIIGLFFNALAKSINNKKNTKD